MENKICCPSFFHHLLPNPLNLEREKMKHELHFSTEYRPEGQGAQTEGGERKA